MKENVLEKRQSADIQLVVSIHSRGLCHIIISFLRSQNDSKSLKDTNVRYKTSDQVTGHVYKKLLQKKSDCYAGNKPTIKNKTKLQT